MKRTSDKKYFFWLVVMATLLTHFLFLDSRPIHFDESINGWFALQIRTMGYYKYDPSNFHGPLYFYLLELFTRLFGHSIEVVRILPSLFSAATILFFLRRSPATAILLLLSPSAVYYGRYGIHESTFVLFQIYFFVGIYEYQKSLNLKSLYLSLLGLAGMMCLKETFLLTGFAAFIALVFYLPWKKLFQDLYRQMKLPIFYFLFVLFMLFTGSAKNLTGLVDFFRAFSFWFQTGGSDSGHTKEFFYWLKLASQAEPLILLALVAAFVGLAIQRFRILSIYALVLFFVYSVTPYKTPWCMISWVWPLYFVFGKMLDESWLCIYFKYSVPAILPKHVKLFCAMLVATICLLSLGWIESWQAVYRSPIDMNHPFVYVNSSYEFKKFDNAIQNILLKRPVLRQEVIQISLDESWPLPWTLQDSKGLHYDRIQSLIYPHALIYFCELEEVPFLDKVLAEGYVSRTMSFRQFGRAVKVYLRADTFTEFP